ncbi:hypothetical protein RRG08_014815 [Elysia crispata]|uniref:Uncharacterized protein n=1 Tax=Elysia crispata TaxID=231223 RepID=A0AAE0ZA53_9GAST|nr:hypothetical protein RRG08_014815 [Elysia crispata]
MNVGSGSNLTQAIDDEYGVSPKSLFAVSDRSQKAEASLYLTLENAPSPSLPLFISRLKMCREEILPKKLPSKHVLLRNCKSRLKVFNLGSLGILNASRFALSQALEVSTNLATLLEYRDLVVSPENLRQDLPTGKSFSNEESLKEKKTFINDHGLQRHINISQILKKFFEKVRGSKQRRRLGSRDGSDLDLSDPTLSTEIKPFGSVISVLRMMNSLNQFF